MAHQLEPDRLTVAEAARPDADATVSAVFDDELDDAPGGARYLTAIGFEAKAGQVAVLPPVDGEPVPVLVGLGGRDDLDRDAVAKAAAVVPGAVKEATSVTTDVVVRAVEAGVDAGTAVHAAVSAVLGATYRFDELKGTGTDEPPDPTPEVELVVPADDGSAAARSRGVAVARGVAMARDLVNRPGGTLGAVELAEVAEAMAADHGLTAEIWDRSRCVDERMGGLLGVNAGSTDEPRFISVTYEPDGEAAGTVYLVGKGITFDSGGLSLKTSAGMTTMKSDMGGAAAVLATMSTLSAVQPDVRVVGLVAATDNMPSGTATKVGDVLTIRNGTTVEVLNTDAEGRLVLADALSLAVEDEPTAIIDLATLTGACMVALGKDVAGLMSTDDELAGRVQAAAERSGEHLWRLPLHDGYRKQLDSKVADVRNIGTGSHGGALLAGLFLREFVGDVPWAHLDIAGPAFDDDGGTGWGVSTLVEFLSPSA